MSRGWSGVQEGVERVGAGVMLPSCTVWRRRVGFAEQCDDEPSAAHPTEARLLARWLAFEGEGLRLRLVLKVGGCHRSVAWLGLSAVGATAEQARARLGPAAEDLGEALDVWRLFPQVPPAGPRYPAQGRGISLVGTSSSADLEPESTLLWALVGLNARSTALTLVAEVRQRRLPEGLLSQIEAARIDVGELGRMEHPLQFMDQLFVARQALKRRANRLWRQVTAGQVRLSLHGRPLGGVMRAGLLDVLGQGLGGAVQLHQGPARVMEDARALALVWGVMSAGSAGEGARWSKPVNLDELELPF